MRTCPSGGSRSSPPANSSMPTDRVGSSAGSASAPRASPRTERSSRHHSADPASGTSTSGAAGRPRTGRMAPRRTIEPSPARSVSTDAPSATAPVSEPSARPGSSRRRVSGSAWRTSAAETRSVGRTGPGKSAAPSSSSTTATSARLKPCPPSSSAMCSPSQPCAAIFSHTGGSSDECGTAEGVGTASASARGSVGGQCVSSQRCAVRRRDSCSSVTAIGIRCRPRARAGCRCATARSRRRGSPARRCGSSPRATPWGR